MMMESCAVLIFLSLAAINSAFIIELIDCIDGQSVCADMSQCVSTIVLCDGYPDCRDGSDERETLCYYKNFTCSSGGVSLRASDRCDGRVDCPDGSDELNCRSSTARPPPTTTTTKVIATTTESQTATATITEDATISTTIPGSSTTNSNTLKEESDQVTLPTTTQQSLEFDTKSIPATLSGSDFQLNEETTSMTTTDLSTSSVSPTFYFKVPDHTAHFTVVEDQEEDPSSSLFLVSLTSFVIGTIGFLAALALTLAVLIPLFNYIKKLRRINKERRRHSFGDPAVLVINPRGNTCFWVYQ